MSDVKPYTMVKTVITEYQIEGEIWIKKDEKKVGAGRPPNLKKWIERYNRGSTFNLDEYYEQFPKDDRDKITKYISEMIADQKLAQLSDKEFKVK